MDARKHRRSNAQVWGKAVTRIAAALLLGFGGGAEAASPPKPQRIVSLNVCTDQLLLMLAERHRIASLTFLASDPSASVMAKAARGIPANRGRGEEVLSLKPDLVLAGGTAATPTVQLLKRLGHRILIVPLARSLADIQRNIRTIAAAIGEEARGENLEARFLEDLNRITRDMRGDARPRVLLLGPGGVTSGTGTLTGALMEAAGWFNAGTEFGLTGVGRMPLETVLGSRADLLIISSLTEEYPSLAAAFLGHPALKKAYRTGAVIRIRHHVWACGSPHVLEPIRRLVEMRARLLAGKSP